MLPLKERLEMYLEKTRLGTFKKWPYGENENCSAQKMAEAGFFCMDSENSPDAAQCFICNKELDGWESSDDPWKEHTSHSPACPFVVIGQPEDLITIGQLSELRLQMVLTYLQTRHQKQRADLIERHKKMRTEINKLIKASKK